MTNGSVTVAGNLLYTTGNRTLSAADIAQEAPKLNGTSSALLPLAPGVPFTWRTRLTGVPAEPSQNPYTWRCSRQPGAESTIMAARARRPSTPIRRAIHLRDR